ncbi:DNA helicase [Tanacetum coccineum]
MAQYPELTPTDRADIVCRVFEQKVKDFLRILKEVKTFGYVTTEISDPVQDPRGYKLVTELMMHGPYGVANLGPDHILAKINNSEASTSAVGTTKQIDKIQNYVDGCFICPYESCWRIFDFPIHYREPAVQILNVHLEDMQRINFHERDRLEIIVNMPEKKKTTLTEWFVYNNENTDGRHLTYLNFPLEFVWYPNSKQWRRRQIRTKKSLERLTYVHPSSSDLFYFRMLLCHQKGCKLPDEVRTVNGQMLPTFWAACEALGLLGDEKEWDIALEESTSSATSKEIRILFTQILIYSDVANPVHLQQELLFVYDHGGIGKTFLWKTIISSLRSQGKIVLAVVSLGIASLLFPVGRTAYSKFTLPLELTDESFCHAKKKSQLGNLLVETDLIIWDEAPMNDKRCFETLDRTLKDLLDAPNVLFGGKTIVLGGDFRKTLPVKKGAEKEELIAASIAESYLWWHFRICTLKENMRLQRSGLTNEERKRSETFAKWLLDVGDGEIGEPEEEDQDSSWIRIPPEYSFDNDETSLSRLINFIYDDTTLKTPTAGSLQEKAIMCPKNATIDDVNAKILSNIEGQRKIYLSNDEAIPMVGETSETELLYPTERFMQRHKNNCPMSDVELPRNMSQHTIAALRIGQDNCILEARVYQKWTSKNISDMKELAFCYILIDREANKDIKNINYFNPLLKLNAVYRFSHFICEKTKPYHQTLGNPISLKFGKITTGETLIGKESEFSEHHFKFITYNQLATRVPYQDENSKMKYPILTDYLGCIRSISDVTPFGDATTCQKYLRKVEIENLE